MLLPRMHMQGVKQLVLSVVCRHWHEYCHISRSRHLERNESVEIGEKLALVCLDSFGTAHEYHKIVRFVGHPY